MKTLALIEKLKKKPVFRIQDIERIAFCERSYAKLVLNRLKKRNLIKKVARNAYTTKDNIFVIASNIEYPSYISFWSASSFFGYTEQVLNTVQVAATKTKKINFEGHTIKFVPIKPFFGYKKIQSDEGEIFIAENEKLLIDILLKPKECGNFDEIKKIFENAEISKKKITEYLKRTNNLTVTKRAGWLLENLKGMDISNSVQLDKNYVLLNPFCEKYKKIDSKWRIKI